LSCQMARALIGRFIMGLISRIFTTLIHLR